MVTKVRQNLEFLQLQYRSLMAVGIDIGAVRAKDFINNLHKFLFQAIITGYLQYGLCRFSVVIFKVKIAKATGALSIFNQGSLLTLKMAVLIYKAEGLLKMIWDINLLAFRANTSENELWMQQNRYSQFISNVYNTACVAAVTCSGILPIIFMTYDYMNGNEVTLKLPFDGKFPYEDRGTHIFVLNYILSLAYIVTLLNISVGIDTFFCWCIFAISGHFRILRHKIHLAAKKIDENNHSDFVCDIGAIVRYHNKVLQFVDDLNTIYGEIFLAEVTFSCLEMCFLIYSLNNDPDLQAMPFNALVFTAISIQMTIYCFGGQKIKTENNMLCDDIYEKFCWEKMLPSEKKLMLLPLRRAQKEISLMSLFFELDRNLLLYIYRTAFSFNTLLSGMKE